MGKEAQKNAKKKWDSENMKTLSCRVRKEVWEDFRKGAQSITDENGKPITTHELLKDYVESRVRFWKEYPELDMNGLGMGQSHIELLLALDTFLVDDLVDIADEKDMRVSMLVNEILEEWIENYDKEHPERLANVLYSSADVKGEVD